MERKIISTAAALGIIAIILGAFGAHSLKQILNLQQLGSFETGVKYQMYHALFLLFIGSNISISDIAKSRIYYLTVTGVLFFSGSIYLLTINHITGLNLNFIGVTTPLGGLLLIAAWLVLLLDVFKKKV